MVHTTLVVFQDFWSHMRALCEDPNPLKNALAVTLAQLWEWKPKVSDVQPAAQTTIILRGDFTSD